MGIELFNNNRGKIWNIINGDHLISHNDNNAFIVVDSPTPVKLYVSSILPAGFSTTIVQKGAGIATVEALAPVTLTNPNNVFSTAIPDDMLKVSSPEPNKFICQGIGSNGGGTGGSGPIKVTSVMFADATKYDDASLVGKSLGIFWNDVNKFLDDSEWNPTATGIEIVIPDFDATANSYTFYISILTAPGGGGGV